MKQNLSGYKRYIFLGIIITSLGVVFNTTLKDSGGSIGTVFIALGGLFFIIGMNKKRKENESKNKS